VGKETVDDMASLQCKESFR